MHIIQSGGLPLIALILYAEVGLFLGFFLPGDTLLIAAGVYAHEGHLSLLGIIVVTAVAAILGDHTGYWLGRRLGPSVFSRPDSVIFRKDHIATAQKFFARYGAKLLLLSHFLPIVRSFTPLLAGVGDMPYKKFAIYNAIGDVAWAISIPLLGYYVGSRIHNIDNYVLIAVGLAVVASLGPALVHGIRLHARRRQSK